MSNLLKASSVFLKLAELSLTPEESNIILYEAIDDIIREYYVKRLGTRTQTLLNSLYDFVKRDKRYPGYPG